MHFLDFNIKLITIFLIVLLISSCKTRISNNLPETSDTIKKISEKEQSYINLTIDIPVSVIEAEINRQFEGLIYEDLSYDKPEKDDVMIRIWKTRDIKIQAYNEFIKFDVPIRIWSSYRWKACNSCPSIEKSTEFNTTISFASKINVRQDWALESQTVPQGYVFESKPKLDFGIVNIPITPIVEPILKEQLNEVCKDIDKEMTLGFNFSKEIDSVWRELHVPQLIDSTYQAWLKISPSEVFISPIAGNKERIRISAGFKGLFEIIIGKEPQLSKIAPLPLLKTIETIDKEFNFFIESFVDFESASNIARLHLKDSILEMSAKRTVKIDDVQFYGLGNKIITKVDLSRNINGSVYFRGTPAYDKTTNLIYFKDFDFDIKTKNALLKSASWILHGTLKNKIEKEFNYSLADDIKSIRKAVSDVLTDYNFDNIFTLKGKLDHLDLHDIIVEENGLRVVINSKGKAQIKIINLNY